MNLENDITTTTYNSNDVPQPLKDAKGRNASKTNSTLTISDAFEILDLNVQLDITHTFVPPERSVYRRVLLRAHRDDGPPLLGCMEFNRFRREG